MPPSLALLLWFVLLVGLLWFDPAKEAKVSGALWLPLAWMFFMGSRGPSLWIGGTVALRAGGMAEALEEGDPLNRTVYLVLFFLSIAILVSRSFRWGNFFARNWALTTFLLFALASVLWSDLPFPAFKNGSGTSATTRWFWSSSRIVAR
jgi:exopolysaccharide production protein ExoQ